MVEPSKRRMKKRKRKTPSGKPGVMYKRPKPSKKTCALCAGVLHGVPNRRPAALSKMTKSQRAPTRLYAGVLCAGCVEQIVKERTRLKAGFITKDDVPLDRLKYLELLK